MDGRDEGARALILAVFRLAVADYRGLSYGHDEPDRPRRTGHRRRRPAAAGFLRSPWAAHLAGLIGLRSATIWTEARRLDALDRSARDRAVQEAPAA